MSEPASGGAEDGAILDAYFDALSRGELVEPSAWIARYPSAPSALLDDLRVIASLHDAACSIAEDALGEVAAESADAGVARGRRLLPEGTRLGDCVIRELLGYGGMGEVYLAVHETLGREVAVKRLSAALADDPAAVSRFRQEVQAQARMSAHPNVVSALHASEQDGLLYLVMEYVRGRDLQREVREVGALPIETACEHVRQAAAGLAHAHRHGIVHRDVKPSNLLLTPEGTVKLLDLGLARLALRERSGDASHVFADELVGSLDYMAPEQADDPESADARSDLYSLGCTFYFLLAGRPPFGDRLMLKKLMAHAVEPPPSIRAQRPEVPEALEQLIARMLAKRPEHRYESMRAFLEALDDVMPGTRTERSGVEVGSRAARTGESPRARVGIGTIALAALLGAMLAATATWLVVRPGDPPPEPEPADVEDPARLAAGRSVSGALTDADEVRPKSDAYYDAYTLPVARGRTYVITLRSRALDPMLIVGDRWEHVESTDVPGLGTSAQVVWSADSDGDVEVLVSSTRRETGTYVLLVEALDLPRLSADAPVTGTLEQGDALLAQDGSWADRWWLPATSGETYVIRMRGEGFRPYLLVLDDDGATLVAGGVRPGSEEARVDYTAARSGTVYVAANAFTPGEGGAYELRVEQPVASGEVLFTTRGELADGDELLPSDRSFIDRHPLPVEAGRTYVITMRASAFDPFLILVDAGDAHLAANDDALGRDARIVWTAESNGTLTVLANSYLAGERGEYTLEARVTPRQ